MATQINLDALKEKAGPIPVWGWIAIITVFGYVYYKRRQSMANNVNGVTSTAGTTGAAATAVDSSINYDPAMLTASYDLSNALGVNTAAVNANSKSATILNSSVGSNTGALGQNTAALNSDKVADTQLATKVGQVSTSPIHTPVARPLPRSSSGSVRPRHNVLNYDLYRVRPGDNWTNLAARFYGNPHRWSRLTAANGLGAKMSNSLHVGQVIKVPKEGRV